MTIRELRIKAYIMYGLLLLACGPLTPDDKMRLIKGNIDGSRAGCLIYGVDKTITRNDKVDMYCQRLNAECPKLDVKTEVRSVP